MKVIQKIGLIKILSIKSFNFFLIWSVSGSKPVPTNRSFISIHLLNLSQMLFSSLYASPTCTIVLPFTISKSVTVFLWDFKSDTISLIQSDLFKVKTNPDKRNSTLQKSTIKLKTTFRSSQVMTKQNSKTL